MPIKHIISQGECLSSIAKNYGFDDWKVIYNYSENAGFKQKHPNPNIISPGEELNIPDLDGRGETGQTDKRHTFEIKDDKTLLRIIVKDMKDNPFGSKKYKLTLASLPPLTGSTGGDGLIEQEIEASMESGKLEVFIHGENEPPTVWELLIGHLDPCIKKSGQQARLNNCGFESGSVDNIDGPITQGAVKRFQTKYTLKVDGVVGSETRPKIEEIHGC